MRKYLWVIVLCMVAVAAWYHFSASDDFGSSASASGGGHSGGHKGSGGNKNAVVPVGVATAKTGDISVYLNGLGNVTPRRTVIVHSLVNGQLMGIKFTEGQMVKKDDMLALIDDRPYTAVLEQAQGIQARDEALLTTAKTDLARYEALWKQDSIAKQQLDTQASLVKQYEGAVKNDQGQVDAAKTNLIYTRITSPVTGRVGLRQVDEGNIVHSTDANGIVIVTELQPITVVFTIAEDNISAALKHVNAGEVLMAEAWDRDNKNKLATGKLTAIDNQVDPSTGTVKFRAEFTNEDNSLFPSQFVNIRLKLNTLTNVVTMPTAAVQRGTKGTFVYLVKTDEKKADDQKADDKKPEDKKPGTKTVAVQDVTLGPAEGEAVSVEKGVTAGDLLVVDGADTLRDGSRIDIAAIDGKATGEDKSKKTGDGKGDKASDSAGDDGAKHHHHHKHDDGDKSQSP